MTGPAVTGAAAAGPVGPLRLKHAVASGTFNLDGGSWAVENNIWVIGDEAQCVVVDAPHDVAPIVELIGDRTLVAVLCTHAHDDHITVAAELARRYGAPVRLHPADDELWQRVHPGYAFAPLSDGEQLTIGDGQVQVVHTPGHTPGGVCFVVPQLSAVFTGDTLFHGGPGATGRSFSDYDTLVASIGTRLFTLPADTVVHTGHGGDTTIGAEAAAAPRWQRPD